LFERPTQYSLPRVHASDPDSPTTGAANPVNPYWAPAAPIDVVGFPSGAAGYAYKSAHPLAKAITVVMGLHVVIDLLVGLNAALTIGVMHRLIAYQYVAEPELAAIDIRARALRALSLAAVLAAVVLFCLFMPRANRNARSFGSPMNMTPGWAAGWFFVPIAFLWKPFHAMKEIWQGSDPDPAAHAFLVPVPPLLGQWWGFYIAHNLARRVQQVSAAAKTPDDLIIASWVSIGASVVSIVAAILAAAVVRAVARRQDERQRRRPAVTAGAAP
jgi:hypothetical protein